MATSYLRHTHTFNGKKVKSFQIKCDYKALERKHQHRIYCIPSQVRFTNIILVISIPQSIVSTSVKANTCAQILLRTHSKLDSYRKYTE